MTIIVSLGQCIIQILLNLPSIALRKSFYLWLNAKGIDHTD